MLVVGIGEDGNTEVVYLKMAYPVYNQYGVDWKY